MMGMAMGFHGAAGWLADLRKLWSSTDSVQHEKGLGLAP